MPRDHGYVCVFDYQLTPVLGLGFLCFGVTLISLLAD